MENIEVFVNCTCYIATVIAIYLCVCKRDKGRNNGYDE